MTHLLRAVGAAGLALALSVPLLGEDAVPEVKDPISARALRYEGTFTWGSRKDPKYTLQLYLTPAGDNQWTAVYVVQWSGKNLLFRGALRGELRDGIVSGTARTEDGKRAWIIRGNSAGGVLSCQHFDPGTDKDKLSGECVFQPEECVSQR